MRGYAQPYAGPRFGISWLFAIYLIAGGIVAATHHTGQNVHSLKAIGLGPAATVLLAADPWSDHLHIH